MVLEAAARLTTPVAVIGQGLVASAVAHADETGLRVAGALQWLPCAVHRHSDLLCVHAQARRDALAAIGLLASFRGILVHDHWSAYAVYNLPARLLQRPAPARVDRRRRNLPPAVLANPVDRPAVCGQRGHLHGPCGGLAALPGPMIDDFFTRYAALLAEGARCHPRRSAPPGERRRLKQSPLTT